MKKQYMDFVPVKAQVKKKKVATGASKNVPKAQASVAPKPVSRVQPKVAPKAQVKIASKPVAKVAPKAQPKVADKVGFAGEKKPALGRVENLNAKFVKSDVPKRPLSRSTYQVPKSQLVQQGKANKRPLSVKNVYPEKKAKKEEPKGPVTIITKPEKQAHAGMIIAIILTIILGAAAGTVAFLLLPK